MIRRFTTTLAALKARVDARRAQRTLERLDDRFLRDVGIHRADIPRRVLGQDPHA